MCRASISQIPYKIQFVDSKNLAFRHQKFLNLLITYGVANFWKMWNCPSVERVQCNATSPLIPITLRPPKAHPHMALPNNQSFS